MPNTVLGKVSVTPRGDYDASTSYVVLDIVGYNGGSYMALQGVSGVTPTNDGVSWMQLAAKGADGTDGEQGIPGAAAGFGTPTATIDDTTGTPSVEVTASGDDTAKVFSFSFSGLKGETGEQGEQGEQGIQGLPGTSVKSIQRTSGTGAPGTTDMYTMYDSDDEEIGTFTVYNGANGTGTGDFMASGIVPMTGKLQMGGNLITGVGTPNADTDAATKGYVDSAVENVSVTTDATPTEGSENPVQSGGVYDALEGKQGALTFDSTPTADSNNPVTSGGIYNALAAKSGVSDAFSVELTAAGWSNNAQTMSNDLFAASGYAYMVNPNDDSYATWVSCQVRPSTDITTAGQMQFLCGETPLENITVNIVRMEVNDAE